VVEHGDEEGLGLGAIAIDREMGLDVVAEALT
jgi:hypothetical protein